jgi:transcriptional regulator GlxA family with amidase domain
MAHTVAFLVYPGFELLDVSGPASVFGQANTALNRLGRRDFYKVEIVSTVGGLMRSSSGVELQTRALSRLPPAKVDTLLIAGAEKESVVAMLDDPALRRWAPRCARAAERFGSICSGAFILASLGMLAASPRTGTPADRWRRRFRRSASTPIRSTSSTARSGPRRA